MNEYRMESTIVIFLCHEDLGCIQFSWLALEQFSNIFGIMEISRMQKNMIHHKCILS